MNLPKVSFNNLVNLESLYGTNGFLFGLSDKILIQFPSAKRLLLILDPSKMPFAI
jgi:hypothetical protein